MKSFAHQMSQTIYTKIARLLIFSIIFLLKSTAHSSHKLYASYHIYDIIGSDVSYLYSTRYGCQLIPDRPTRDYMLSWRTNSKIEVSAIPKGSLSSFCTLSSVPLVSTNIADDNADNILLKHIRLFENIQGSGRVFYDSVEIPNCFNPSISHWKGLIFLACRGRNKPVFGWLDPKTFKLIDYQFYGIGPGLATIPHIVGEDFRLLALNNDTMILSLSFFHSTFLQMRVGELIALSNGTIAFLRDRHLLPQHSMIKSHQKNWCPFIYNGKIYFMSQLEPMTTYNIVFKSTNHSKDGIMKEHIAPAANVSWMYGMIKGGTNARRITNTTYLGFFHSKQFLQPSFLTTYVFGAYTFEAKPPFRLLTWSVTPLVHHSWYEGEWSHYKNLVDYIVFPMTYEFADPGFDYRKCNNHDCLNQTELLLSVGIQDKTGHIVKINMLQLINTLSPINHYTDSVPLQR